MASLRDQFARKQQFRSTTPRKALQPKNSIANHVNILAGIRQKNDLDQSPCDLIFAVGDPDKENRCLSPMIRSAKIESPIEIDASLAEELVAIRQKLERLRLEKEKTEMLLKERDLVLEKKLEQFRNRGKEQEKLEIELNKLQRFRELKACIASHAAISLREKEKEKQTEGEAQMHGLNSSGKEIMMDKNIEEAIADNNPEATNI